MQSHQLASRINALNADIGHIQQRRHDWRNKEHVCTSTLTRIHNTPARPGDIQGHERRRHEQTIQRNRLNTCRENIAKCDERIRARIHEVKQCQKDLERVRERERAARAGGRR